MTRYDIREATGDDARYMARNARAIDIEEAYAMWGPVVSFDTAVYSCWAVSRYTAFVGTCDDIPMCLFGVKPGVMLNPVARPWMIATPTLEDHARKFLRSSIAVVDLWKKEFEFMENYVYERNVQAVRWLQWLGFSVYYPEPFGPMSLPFHRFEMRA